jgi:PAS domain S-box-containing protein
MEKQEPDKTSRQESHTDSAPARRRRSPRRRQQAPDRSPMPVEHQLALYQAVWEHTADAMVFSDAEGIVRAANPAYYQLYGYTPEEVIGSSFAIIFPEDQREQAIAHYKMVFREELAVPTYEAIIHRKDGTERIVESRVEFLTVDGARVGMLSIIRDITERRQVREAFQEQQEFIKTLLEQFPTGSINVFDSDLRYLMAEGKGLAQVGMTSHQLVGKTLAEVFPEESVAYVTPFYQKAFAGETVAFELSFGGYTYELHAAPLKYARMAISAILVIAHDVTARKRAEEERLRLLTREAQLYESEQRARIEAQEAVRVRDAFLSVASHELKNPLTTIMGNAELLQRRAAREGGLTERDQRVLTVIVEQTNRLDEMITTLFDISRIEMGQFQIERDTLDIAALTQRVVANIQPTLAKHTITLRGTAAPLLVAGDALRLEQVLHNLIQNAIKYSPRGGDVDIQVEQRDMLVSISITDRGIGIPPAEIPLLFRRFYRAESARAQHIEGTGIGLYVAKEIITLHGGDVRVDSTEGKGSTFTISLPVLEHSRSVP